MIGENGSALSAGNGSVSPLPVRKDGFAFSLVVCFDLWYNKRANFVEERRANAAKPTPKGGCLGKKV